MGPASRRAVACCCCRAARMTYFWLWGLAGGASVRHSVLTYVCVCVCARLTPIMYLLQQDVSSRYLTPLVCMHLLAWTWAHAPACDRHLLCCCVVLSATFCSIDPESLVQWKKAPMLWFGFGWCCLHGGDVCPWIDLFKPHSAPHRRCVRLGGVVSRWCPPVGTVTVAVGRCRWGAVGMESWQHGQKRLAQSVNSSTSRSSTKHAHTHCGALLTQTLQVTCQNAQKTCAHYMVKPTRKVETYTKKHCRFLGQVAQSSQPSQCCRRCCHFCRCCCCRAARKRFSCCMRCMKPALSCLYAARAASCFCCLACALSARPCPTT